MSNQIGADEIEQSVTKTTEQGEEIRDAWAKISAGKQTEPTTEQGEEIRDAWAKIAAEN